jgi:hypothetical protein
MKNTQRLHADHIQRIAIQICFNKKLKLEKISCSIVTKNTRKLVVSLTFGMFVIYTQKDNYNKVKPKKCNNWAQRIKFNVHMKHYKRHTILSVTISLKLSWRTLATCCFDVVATIKFQWQNLIYTQNTKKVGYAMKMCVIISFKFLWRRLTTHQQNRMKERLANNCYNKTYLKKRND